MGAALKAHGRKKTGVLDPVGRGGWISRAGIKVCS